jgi:hypothetical protein
MREVTYAGTQSPARKERHLFMQLVITYSGNLKNISPDVALRVYTHVFTLLLVLAFDLLVSCVIANLRRLIDASISLRLRTSK